jgi:hypothetical protein
MRIAGLAIAALLLVSQSARVYPQDRAKPFLIGTYIGNTDAGDALAHNIGLNTLHFRQERPNLLDNLKRGDRFAFRVEADHRIGATKTSFHAYVPRADDPKKEDKFDAEFTPIPTPDTTAAAPVDNVKAMCDAHRFTPEQEKQYCGTAQELPVDQPTKN